MDQIAIHTNNSMPEEQRVEELACPRGCGVGGGGGGGGISHAARRKVDCHNGSTLRSGEGRWGERS